MKFGKIGKSLVSGAVKAGQTAEKGLERYDRWEGKYRERNITKQERRLKSLELKAKIAKQKAEIEKYKPKSDW